MGARAVSWKDFTLISGGKLGWLTRLGVILLVVAIVIYIFSTTANAPLSRELAGGCLILISLLMMAIFLASDAARVFAEEIRWKTLSSLVTLPVSIPELAYHKVAGVLAGTLPLLVVTVAGMCLVPEAIGKFMDELSSSTKGLGTLFITVAQFVLFLHLTAYLSLVIKRGALALAFAIQYLGGSFLMTLLALAALNGGGPGAGDGLEFFVALICLALTVILHAAIGRRLARAAAEE
jgi:hypothetical protein